MRGSRVLFIGLLALALSARRLHRWLDAGGGGRRRGHDRGTGRAAVPSQGVTDDEVAVGVAWIDAEEILAQFGVDIGVYPVGDSSRRWPTGSTGGAASPTATSAWSSRPLTDNSETDRICTQLLQDEEVFVVTGTLLNDRALCVTSSTASRTSAPSGRHRRSRSARRVGSCGRDRSGEDTLASVQEMVDAGDLEGHEVGLYSDASDLDA